MLRTKPRRGSLRRDALSNATICYNDMERALQSSEAWAVGMYPRKTDTQNHNTHTGMYYTSGYKYFRTPAVLRGAGGADVRTCESKQAVASMLHHKGPH
jgi:hypothetical protein